MEFISPSISILKDLIQALSKKSRSKNIHKKLLIRELIHNLDKLSLYNSKGVDNKLLINRLSTEAYKNAILEDFKFSKLKKGRIEAKHTVDKRNQKYIGWDSEQLIDLIDRKIEDLQTIVEVFPDIKKSRKNLKLRLGNLFYRVKLLAEFINE